MLSELFEYVDGKLYNKSNRSSLARKGMEAGVLDKNQMRVYVSVNGMRQFRSRIVWAMHNGRMPKMNCEIDHINGNTMDDRIENLREVTRGENARNLRLDKRNRHGITGIDENGSRNKRYRVRIGNKTIAYCDDFFEACCRRKSAERAGGYNINHGRQS